VALGITSNMGPVGALAWSSAGILVDSGTSYALDSSALSFPSCLMEVSGGWLGCSGIFSGALRASSGSGAPPGGGRGVMAACSDFF
jgi:hypothetical protein